MAQAAIGVKRYAPFFRKNSAMHVLDYGTGNMRNAFYLAEQGFSVVAADLPGQVAALRRQGVDRRVAALIDTDTLAHSFMGVDVVISTYVFNIIDAGAEQRRYLQTIVNNLRPGGYLLFEVRCRRQETTCGSGCSHYFKCQSCVKTYTHEELDQLLRPFGFVRQCHYYRQQALVALYQFARKHERDAA